VILLNMNATPGKIAAFSPVTRAMAQALPFGLWLRAHDFLAPRKSAVVTRRAGAASGQAVRRDGERFNQP
jgi:hypothetical protein